MFYLLRFGVYGRDDKPTIDVYITVYRYHIFN